VARKITLRSYVKAEASSPLNEHILMFIGTCGRGRLLFMPAGIEAVHASERGLDVTVFDDDLVAIQSQKDHYPNLRYEYGSFNSFAKRSGKDQFAVVIDNGFSSRIRRSDAMAFYREIAKMLATGGTLLTRVLSTDDPYCALHCPERKWTMVKEQYMNYFTKEHLITLLKKAGFKDSSYALGKTDSGTYHVIVSTLKLRKL
jgi:hypothetical protein